MRFRLFTVVGFAAVLASVVLFSATATAQKKGKSRPAMTKDIMGNWVQPTCKKLGDELKKDSPNWEKARSYASLLHEIGFLLMDDGRCPSGDWAKGNDTLKKCSAVVIEKIEAQDSAGAKSAFKGLTGGCATCHKAHKKG